MSARMVLQAFEAYQKARMSFVQTVCDLSSRPESLEFLEEAGALDLLKPLLGDVVPSIQMSAATALGRLANHDERAAETMVRKDVIPLIVMNISKQTKFYRRAALTALRAVSKHSPEMAHVVVDCGGLEAMVVCVEDFDTPVKEAAAWGLGYIARHSKQLSQQVIDSGAVPLLVLAFQEPELCLKQISASALADIAKHSHEQAQTCVDAGCVPHLARAIANQDTKLKRQVMQTLAAIAKHTLELAELVVEAEVFPELLVHMGHPDDLVKRNAAMLIKECIKHSLEFCQMVTNMGGVAALVDLIQRTQSSTRLQGVMCLGYIAASSEHLAWVVVGSKGVSELDLVLLNEKEDHVLAATVWAIGCIGKHTPEHSKAVALCSTFPKILQMYLSKDTSQDLKSKAHAALKLLLQKCMHIPALEPLMPDAPPHILQYVLAQFSKILPNDPKARRYFVTSGALRKMQAIQCEPGSLLTEYIMNINFCFPEEVIRYYSPGYPETLLERVEQYQPRLPSLFAVEQQDVDREASQVKMMSQSNVRDVNRSQNNVSRSQNNVNRSQNNVNRSQNNVREVNRSHMHGTTERSITEVN